MIDPRILRLPDGSWRMWFKNERAKDGSIYFADSPALLRWTAKGVALSGSKGEGPKVFHWRDRYWLVFDAWDGLGVYSSDDCLHWKRQERNLVKEPGRLPTDRTKVIIRMSLSALTDELTGFNSPTRSESMRKASPEDGNVTPLSKWRSLQCKMDTDVRSGQTCKHQSCAVTPKGQYRLPGHMSSRTNSPLQLME